MNKELQKLLKQINDKKNEVKSLVNDGKLDKAKAAKEELKELQNRFDLLYDLDEEEQDGIEDKVNNGTAKQVGGDVKPDKKNIVKSFVNIVKAGFLHKEADEADIKVYKDALTSDTTAGSEGEVGIGVTIPEDIRTDIIELRRSSDNLEQYDEKEMTVKEYENMALMKSVVEENTSGIVESVTQFQKDAVIDEYTQQLIEEGLI